MAVIPPELLDRIGEFLARHRNGTIILNVQDGAIMTGELCEAWRRPKASRTLSDTT